MTRFSTKPFESGADTKTESAPVIGPEKKLLLQLFFSVPAGKKLESRVLVKCLFALRFEKASIIFDVVKFSDRLLSLGSSDR